MVCTGAGDSDCLNCVVCFFFFHLAELTYKRLQFGIAKAKIANPDYFGKDAVKSNSVADVQSIGSNCQG